MSKPDELDLLRELLRASGIGAQAIEGWNKTIDQVLSLAFFLHAWAATLQSGDAADTAEAVMAAETASAAYQIMADACARRDAMQPEMEHLLGTINMMARDGAQPPPAIH